MRNMNLFNSVIRQNKSLNVFNSNEENAEEFITLYHATTWDFIDGGKVDLNFQIGSVVCEFGRGFYTTRSKEQAIAWTNFIYGIKSELYSENESAIKSLKRIVIEFKLSKEVFQDECIKYYLIKDKKELDRFIDCCMRYGINFLENDEPQATYSLPHNKSLIEGEMIGFYYVKSGDLRCFNYDLPTNQVVFFKEECKPYLFYSNTKEYDEFGREI